MDVHDAEGKHLSTFTAQAGETLTFDLVGDELVTPDGKHRIHKAHRWVCTCGVMCGVFDGRQVVVGVRLTSTTHTHHAAPPTWGRPCSGSCWWRRRSRRRAPTFTSWRRHRVVCEMVDGGDGQGVQVKSDKISNTLHTVYR